MHPYTAFFGADYMDVPLAGKGIYKTYSACLLELEEQKKLYEAHTGFQSIAVTCQEGSDPYEKSFVLRIDGFSTDPKKLSEPARKLYAFSPRFRGQTDEALYLAVENLVTKLGGSLALRTPDSVFYYSKYPAHIRYDFLGMFRSTEECTSQLDQAYAVFFNLGSKTVLARCLQDKDPKYANQASLEIVRDRPIGDPSYVTDTSQYYSFSECMSDRVRVMDEATSRGYTPLGAICRKTWNDKYELQLFRKLF